jgi:hypothetical protein
MSPKSYTLDPTEKATPVMVGTADMLLWGDLVTKQRARIVGYLTTLAEDFVPLHDVKVLFLSPREQVAPMERPIVYVKLEEILTFHPVGESEPLPEETEVRRFVPIEVVVSSYHIEAMLLKSPVASLESMLTVSKEAYLPLYKAVIRHIANPWLGTFSTNMVQVRRDRMAAMSR